MFSDIIRVLFFFFFLVEEFLPREMKEESLVIPKKVEVNSFGITYDSLEEIMKSFTFMDNRSCTCMEIISYIFWQISQHIYQISNVYKFNFLRYDFFFLSTITTASKYITFQRIFNRKCL